mmetsp:Transcript_4513/g.10844  ORF Transcript_4513/g.10844 Transcript_4513/m.10844 type:complete len:91 (+) Transcript_4513:326-598(+)
MAIQSERAQSMSVCSDISSRIFLPTCVHLFRDFVVLISTTTITATTAQYLVPLAQLIQQGQLLRRDAFQARWSLRASATHTIVPFIGCTR